jgi:hypothetical protein
MDPQHGIKMFAGPGTIVHFDDKGLPAIMTFLIKANNTVEGEYGIDASGRPNNSGRLIFKQADPSVPMPFVVNGAKDIYTYHLGYLEVTTAELKLKDYRPYAIKAIAFDNKVEVLGKPSVTYKMPEGGLLPIVNGKIKFGDDYVSPGPDYNLSGEIR